MTPITAPEVWLVVWNGLWILGLALLLATWSSARYAAREDGRRTRDLLREPGHRLAVDMGVMLFVAGIAATEQRWWARILWGAIGTWVIAQSVVHLRESRAHKLRDAAAAVTASGASAEEPLP